MGYITWLLVFLTIGIAGNAQGQIACESNEHSVIVEGSANLNKRLDPGDQKAIPLPAKETSGFIFCTLNQQSATKVQVDTFDCEDKTILEVSLIAGVLTHKCKAAPPEAKEKTNEKDKEEPK